MSETNRQACLSGLANERVASDFVKDYRAAKIALPNFIILLLLLLILSWKSGVCEDLTWSTKVFPNGFTLITKEVHSHPSCSVHLFVSVGSSYENPSINGISHFYEHLFFKGTPTRTSTQMKSEIENYGGDLNGATYRDYTEFIIDIPAVFVDKAIDLLLDAFQDATLDSIELEKERKVVLDEVNLENANPERRLADLFDKAMYTVHPYKMVIAGDPDSVKHITRDDLLRWKSTYYVPNNAYLVVAGDIDEKKIENQVKQIIEKIPATPYTSPAFPKEPAKTSAVVQEKEEQVNQAYFLLGYLVAGLDRPEDIYPLDVLTFMLGYGRSNLLTRELKDKLHLVNNISADFLTQRYPGVLQIEGVCNPDQLEPSKKKILDILEHIKKGDLDDKEVVRAKTLLEGVYTLGNQTNSGRVSTIGFYVAAGAGDFAKSYLSHIKQVKLSDIMRIANTYFQNNYVEEVFLPKSSAKGGSVSP